MNLTPEERELLDKIRFEENRRLKGYAWELNRIGATKHTAAADMDWFKPHKRGKPAVLDVERAEPVLESLVGKGQLVVIDERPHLVTKQMTKIYATPEFKERYESNLDARRHGAWAQEAREAGLTPFEK